MKFKTKSGTELEIDLQKWQFPTVYKTNIVDETTDDFLLADANDCRVYFAKRIVEVNGIEVKEREIVISDSLYQYYFVSEIRKLNDAADVKFRSYINIILNNKDLILSHGEFFLLPPGFASGDTLGGGFQYCIGALLESWMYSDELKIKDLVTGDMVNLVSIGGSRLSGAYSAVLWSPGQQEIIRKSSGQNERYPMGKLGDHLAKLRDLTKDYPYNIDYRYRAINKLLGMLNITD